MITATNVLILLAMIVGTIGIVAPILPGLLIVWLASVIWAFEVQTATSWVVLGVTTAVYAVGLVAQYLVPGRRMKAAGVDTKIIAAAVVIALVGFFVIPVVGAPLGFIGGIYLLERVRHRDHVLARAATGRALRAVGLNIGIELLTALGIIATWVIGVWFVSM